MEEQKHKIINVRERFNRTRTAFDKLADVISAWCGSWSFLILHFVWFAWWLIGKYDINTLTMIVSLEAIILMAILLMSQQRQAERYDLRDEADYQADIHSEQMLDQMREMMQSMKNDISEIKSKR